MLGFYIFVYLNKIKNLLPKFFKGPIFLNMCAIIIIILIILYLFNFISIGGIL